MKKSRDIETMVDKVATVMQQMAPAVTHNKLPKSLATKKPG